MRYIYIYLLHCCVADSSYYFLVYVNWKGTVNHLCTLVTNGTCSTSALSWLFKFTLMDFINQLFTTIKIFVAFSLRFRSCPLHKAGITMVRFGIVSLLLPQLFCSYLVVVSTLITDGSCCISLFALSGFLLNNFIAHRPYTLPPLRLMLWSFVFMSVVFLDWGCHRGICR